MCLQGHQSFVTKRGHFPVLPIYLYLTKFVNFEYWKFKYSLKKIFKILHSIWPAGNIQHCRLIVPGSSESTTIHPGTSVWGMAQEVNLDPCSSRENIGGGTTVLRRLLVQRKSSRVNIGLLTHWTFVPVWLIAFWGFSDSGTDVDQRWTGSRRERQRKLYRTLFEADWVISETAYN